MSDRSTYYQQYAEANRVRRRQTRREWEARLREEVLAHYGGRCCCCGEQFSEFLVVEHRKGSKERRRLMGQDSGSVFYWLKRNGFPSGFRVLCLNCRAAYELLDYCPHRNLVV